jgi:hypothetical protein
MQPKLNKSLLFTVKLVLKHFRANTMVTTQLHIALAWCQRMSGVFHPIPEAPSILLPHLETSFFPSLLAYFPTLNRPSFWKRPTFLLSNGQGNFI